MMKFKYYISLILVLTSLFYVNINVVNIGGSESTEPQSVLVDWETVNLDGDVSLTPMEDASIWNHHRFRFDEGADWGIHFGEDVTMSLKTSWGDAGHIAAGMWWTSGFKEKGKFPIHDKEIRVNFDIYLEKFVYHGPEEWLRVALACAVQRMDGNVVYTEVDISDSPNTMKHPEGNIDFGGDIIYQGGDVVEFKLDEIPLRTWKHYSLNLTGYIDRAWEIEEGDQLESVYIVIESDNNPVEVELKIDNFWIYRSSL